MTNSMGPPPPINPNLPDTAPSVPPPHDSTEPQPPAPPPPRDSLKPPSQGAAVPYKIPPWSAAPCHKFYLEVLKDGSIIDKFDVCEKGAYMFGRLDLCDFVLEHPTISRFHAASFLDALPSMFKVDVLMVGFDQEIAFALSADVIETNAKLMKEVKMREAMLDREASVRRARQEASLAEGISWGMGEDAIEEEEDDAEEVTWQSYKGQLTEKQEKTHLERNHQKDPVGGFESIALIEALEAHNTI
ncbi:hypothetical protein V8G54_019139 [Vigna mungo]|uniref:FHA domain-containing protein n=1 Tax=Vigna mungo TaxID=3915 RepID=A0AAQ3RUN2_VIGMU